MTDRLKAAFTAASDLTKQLLTLGSAVVGVTVTFSKDLIERIPESDRWRLEVSWCLLALSLIAGIVALMALAGALGNSKDVSDADLKVYRPSIRFPFALQVVLFVAGFGFLIFAGTAVIDVPSPASTETG